MPGPRPTPLPRRGRILVVGACVFAMLTVTTTGAAWGAEASGGVTRSAGGTVPDPDTYRDLAAQLFRNQRAVIDVAAQLEQAESRLAQTQRDLDEVQRRLDETRAELQRLEDLVRSRAAFIYAHARTSNMAVADIAHVADISSGKQYAESATRRDVNQIDDLTAQADALDAKRRTLVDARDAQTAERDKLRAQKDDLDARIVRQKEALDRAGAVTMMGEPELTGAQMSEWFASRGVRYRLMGGMTITELADLYVEEGKAEHVRPELAFVQAILETGSFGNATDNNFAGIGACDSCTGQIPFPTPRDGVRGQIQMLRNYADPSSRAAALANPPSAPIYGSDPARAANAYDTFFAKGRTPTWNLMGDGNWATDPDYSPKVLTLYFQLMAFATRRP